MRVTVKDLGGLVLGSYQSGTPPELGDPVQLGKDIYYITEIKTSCTTTTPMKCEVMVR